MIYEGHHHHVVHIDEDVVRHTPLLELFYGFFSSLEPSKEMIFALKEKDSDEIPFSADLYRQSALPNLAG